MEHYTATEPYKMNLPKWIVLQLLEKCNLRCRMCYEWGETGSYHNKASLNQLDVSAIKRLVEACKGVKPYYELFGGEPLMYAQAAEVISFIRGSGSMVDMATNGLLLGKSAEMLVEAGLTRVWVSLDGTEEINDRQRGNNTYKRAVEGMKTLLEVRNRAGKQNPRVGVTTIITPGNYHCIEEFFFNLIKECKLEHISIEFQTYATHEQYCSYSRFAAERFGVSDTGSAKGLVQDTKEFEGIDTLLLEKQLRNIRDYCGRNDILFFNNPHTIDQKNYRNYFTANWDRMSDIRSKCPFPWIHAEITAKGEVVMCHTFHDLTFGNINEQGIQDIWNGEKSRTFRKLVKSGTLPMCTACSRYYSHTAGIG